MPYPISRTTKVIELISSARELSRATSASDIITAQEKLIYRLSILEIAGMIINAGERSYNSSIEAFLSAPNILPGLGGVSAERLGTTREFVILLQFYYDEMFIGLRYAKILGLSSSAECIYRTPMEYFDIKNSSFRSSTYRNSIIWTIYNDTIYMMFGDSIALPTDYLATLTFARVPIVPETDMQWINDYVDLPDIYIPALMHRLASIMLYQKSGQLLEPSLKFLDIFYQSLTMNINLEAINTANIPEDKKRELISQLDIRKNVRT